MNRSIHFCALCTTLLLLCALTAAPVHAADWYDSSWSRRIAFAAVPDSIEGNADLEQFTLVLDLGSADFDSVFAFADPTGADLVITGGDGLTVLPHELVSYDPLGHAAEIWFRTPVLSDLQNSFYLYYGNPAAGEMASLARSGTPGAAWSPDHLAVYHFTEDPSLGVLADWGPGMNHAVAAVAPSPVGPGWLSSDLVSGAVGAGWQFDGVDLWCYSTEIASADSSFTIGAWFANSPLVDGGAMAFQANNTVFDLSFQVTAGSPLADIHTPTGQITWLPQTTDFELHHYVWTLDAEADTVRFYFDGVERPVWTRYTPPGEEALVYSGLAVDTRVGIASPYDYNPLDLADGVVDEYRIIEGVRSADWIRTEFRNQRDAIGFFSVAAEETYSGGATGVGPYGGTGGVFGGLRVWPNPFQGRAFIDVETGLTSLAVQVYDTRGRLVRTLPQPESRSSGTLRFLWDGRDSAGTLVGNGIYFIRSQSGQSVVSTKAMVIR